ncbi:MAG: hypothetical protein ABJA67_06320 [Chthonomonadales bacterium]
MRKILSQVCLVFAVFICINGCGGGSSPDGGSGSLTDTQRLAVLNAVTAKFESLPGVDPDKDNQEMLRYLQGRPEFKDSGVGTDQCVWAHLTNGHLLVIINNRTVDMAARSSVSRTRAAYELPKSSHVRAFWGFGQNISPAVFTFLPWLNSNGYEAPGQVFDMTLETLKTVTGDGIVYMDCHGGHAVTFDNKHIVFALPTNTEVTVDNMATNRADMGDYTLSYTIARAIKERSAGRGIVVRPLLLYGITSKFVEKYMSFGANSFVFVNACDSNDYSFRQACFLKGASVYGGWTNTIDDGAAFLTGKYVFDRLLGGSKFIKDEPPQRPFDLASITTSMREQGIDTFTNHMGQLTNIVFTSNSSIFLGNFGLLAPSIETLGVTEEVHELEIYGKFGTIPGTVTIGGNDLAVKPDGWKPDRIICSGLPDTAKGDVVVTVGGHDSNHVPLTVWHGKVHLKVEFLDDGDTHFNVDWDLKFRGDVHGWRLKPGEAVDYGSVNGLGMSLVGNSKATYQAGGSVTRTGDDGSFDTTILSATKSSFPSPYPESNGLDHFSAGMSIDVPNKQMTIECGGYLTDGLNVHFHSNVGSDDTKIALDLLGYVGNYGVVASTVVLPLVLPLDTTTFSVPAGDKPSVTAGPNHIKYTLTWDAFTADPATIPTDQTSRSAKVISGGRLRARAGRGLIRH